METSEFQGGILKIVKVRAKFLRQSDPFIALANIAQIPLRKLRERCRTRRLRARQRVVTFSPNCSLRIAREHLEAARTERE
jgi:hypothetical protein